MSEPEFLSGLAGGWGEASHMRPTSYALLQSVEDDSPESVSFEGIKPCRYLTSRRKRAFDLVVAVPACVLSAPIVIVLAVASLVAHRAWPIFTQTRVGQHGAPFKFVKIRSLPSTAPAYADKYQLSSIQMTRTGQFLRATHLDELPQFALVVSGHMSIVGPRPEMPELSRSYDPAFVAARVSIPPGCTGLWQVSEHANLLIGEHPEHDIDYLQNANLRMDCAILKATVASSLPTLLRRTRVTTSR